MKACLICLATVIFSFAHGSDQAHIVKFKANDFSMSFPCNPVVKSTKTSVLDDLDMYECPTTKENQTLFTVTDLTFGPQTLPIATKKNASDTELFTELKKSLEKTNQKANMTFEPDKYFKIGAYSAAHYFAKNKDMQAHTIVIRKGLNGLVTITIAGPLKTNFDAYLNSPVVIPGK